MKCQTPKRFLIAVDGLGKRHIKAGKSFWQGIEFDEKEIIYKQGVQFYQAFVPCNRCYACQCMNRAEWALRAKYEYNDPHTKSAYFITLTYDDEHVPTLFDDAPEQRKFLLDYMKHLPRHKRNYRYITVLDKSHISDFLKKLQLWIKVHCYPDNWHWVDTSTGELLPDDHVKVWGDHSKHVFVRSEKNHCARFVLTGEYGDRTKRAHYHILLFLPVKLPKVDVIKMLRDCWTDSNGVLRCSEKQLQKSVGNSFKAQCINYVAKHQVKSCKGSYLQEAVAPIFSNVSRYKGGIGFSLKEDEHLRYLYEYEEDGTHPWRYLKNYQGSIEYKMPYPRFLTRYYRNDRNLDTFELSEFERKSNENFNKFLLEQSEKFPEIFNNIPLDNTEKFLPLYLAGLEDDRKKRSEYELKRLLRSNDYHYQGQGFVSEDDCFNAN